MGAWTEAVEEKARVIHGQIGAARALAERIGEYPNKVDRPYLDDAEKQRRLQAQVAPLIGSICGDDPNRAEEASRRVRDILAEKHARTQ